MGLSLMRFSLIDENTTISLVAPGNILKALVAGCSNKPSPSDVFTLLEQASRYDTGLYNYVMNGLAIFDEHYISVGQESTQIDPHLQQELREILQTGPESLSGSLEDRPEISIQELSDLQKHLSGKHLTSHPVLRVVDEATRTESLQPVKAGLVLFNLKARRIVQVQNSSGILQRSDRGRYFENGQPTERLYFYRLPADWSMVP